MENFTEQLKALRSGEALPSKRNGYWSLDDKNALERMFADNAGVSEIAVTLGRSEVSVSGRLRSMGLFEPQCRFRRKKAKENAEPQCRCAECVCKDCIRHGKDCHEAEHQIN